MSSVKRTILTLSLYGHKVCTFKGSVYTLMQEFPEVSEWINDQATAGYEKPSTIGTLTTPNGLVVQFDAINIAIKMVKMDPMEYVKKYAASIGSNGNTLRFFNSDKNQWEESTAETKDAWEKLNGRRL